MLIGSWSSVGRAGQRVERISCSEDSGHTGSGSQVQLQPSLADCAQCSGHHCRGKNIMKTTSPGLALPGREARMGHTNLDTKTDSELQCPSLIFVSSLLLVRRRNSFTSKEALNREVSIICCLGAWREQS